MGKSRWSITLGREASARLVCDEQQPLPRDGIRVAPRWCGICGTDLDIVRRIRPDRPSVLGHEAFVYVVDKGKDADWQETSSTGAVINPVSSVDQNRNVGHSLPGIWCTSRVMIFDEIGGGQLIGWAGYPTGPEAALAEPLAAVVYADEIIGGATHGEGSVLIVGSGCFAALAALYFLRMGLRCTIAGTSRSNLHDLERSLGFENLTTRERNRPLSYPHFDAALVAVSRPASETAIDFALAHVRNGGVVDLVGAPQGKHLHWESIRRANVCGVPQGGVSRLAVGPNGSVRVTGQRGTGARHIRQAMALLQHCPTFWRKAVTHILPLGEVPAVVTALARHRAASIDGRGVGKAIIDMSCPIGADSFRGNCSGAP